MTPIAIVLLLLAGPAAAPRATPASAGTTADTSLHVQSEPAGAAVYVDGAFVGRTPLLVHALTAGDHRVRLEREGYLENGRILTLARGRAGTLRIRLTQRPAAQAPAPGGQGAFRIVVLAGEDGVNILDKKTAVQPVVQVLDRNNLPVSGASVVLTLGGRGATFANGARQVTLTTDVAGRAAVTGLTPTGNGTLQIGVRAAFQGQTATATIHQVTYATLDAAAKAGSSAGSAGAVAGGATGGLSGAAIGGIVAGAAGGTLVAVKAASSASGGSSGSGGNAGGGASACDSTCTVSSTSMTIGNQGGVLSVNVTAPGGRTWTATSSDAFVAISAGNSGSGNGVVVLNVAANTGSQRTGHVSIAGQTVLIAQTQGDVFGVWNVAFTPSIDVTPCAPPGGPTVIFCGQVVSVDGAGAFHEIWQGLVQVDGTLTTTTLSATLKCATSGGATGGMSATRNGADFTGSATLGSQTVSILVSQTNHSCGN